MQQTSNPYFVAPMDLSQGMQGLYANIQSRTDFMRKKAEEQRKKNVRETAFQKFQSGDYDGAYELAATNPWLVKEIQAMIGLQDENKKRDMVELGKHLVAGDSQYLYDKISSFNEQGRDATPYVQMALKMQPMPGKENTGQEEVKKAGEQMLLFADPEIWKNWKEGEKAEREAIKFEEEYGKGGFKQKEEERKAAKEGREAIKFKEEYGKGGFKEQAIQLQRERLDALKTNNMNQYSLKNRELNENKKYREEEQDRRRDELKQKISEATDKQEARQVKMELDKQRKEYLKAQAEDKKFKREEAKTLKDRAKRVAVMDMDETFNKIGELRNEIKENMFFTGLKGEALKYIKSDWNPAYLNQEALDSIKSRLGLDTLIRMKSLSPSGASGFGALSGPELQLLQDRIASLELGMGPKLDENLKYVMNYYRWWRDEMITGKPQQRKDYVGEEEEYARQREMIEQPSPYDQLDEESKSLIDQLK